LAHPVFQDHLQVSQEFHPVVNSTNRITLAIGKERGRERGNHGTGTENASSVNEKYETVSVKKIGTVLQITAIPNVSRLNGTAIAIEITE
jgi:hypothetical protein